jgi:hypothetical protein
MDNFKHIDQPKPINMDNTDPRQTFEYIVFDRTAKTTTVRRFFSRLDRSLKKSFNYSIDKIDSVHESNIEFANIPVVEINDINIRGILHFDPDTGNPYRLEISKNNSQKEITIFHEIGHLIDLLCVGEPGKFESDDPLGAFSHLLILTSETDEIIKIKNILASGYTKIDDKLLPLHYSTRTALCYLLEPREIVARTYAQYIAEKSKSQKLLKMIRDRNNSSIFGGQWSSSNFQPILKEWDNVLNAIGWQTKK